MTATLNPTRRYDLDWLRIIAFGLLIFYHVGMFYVTWDWHVKSRYAGPFAEPAMMLLNPWRLALLFFISGVAFRFAADKIPALSFAWQRFYRLFVPLVFGMWVIVTPQAYFQLLGTGEIEPGYLAFWGQYLMHRDFSITVPTWNHLWYVIYLLTYTLAALPLMPMLRKLAHKLDGSGFERVFGGGRLLLLVAPFIVYRFTTDMWFPTTHALVDDWNAHANYFTMFLYGAVLSKNTAFWRTLANSWRPILVLTIALGAVLTPLWMHWDQWLADAPILTNIARAARILYAWSAILSLLGFAQAYLNRPSPVLTYLTGAVFPYYILHQSLIVVFGVWLTPYAIGVGPEFAALVILTTLGCGLGYHYLIRPFGLVRPLFGVFGKMRLAKATLQPAE